MAFQKNSLKTIWLVFKNAVIAGLLFIVFSLILTTIGPIREWQFLRVLSGSMEPTIKTGSIILIKKIDPNQLKEGDIITYSSLDNPNILVTHRLVSIKETEAGQVKFLAKGDANEVQDSREIDPASVKGKLVFTIPFLGYISIWVRKPLGFILMIVLPAVLIILSEIINIKKAIEEEVKKRSSQPFLLILLLLNSLFIPFISGTNAYFSDKIEAYGVDIQMGDWTRPRSWITSDFVISDSKNFRIEYNAEDNALDYVELWYSYNKGNWRLFDTDHPHSLGRFDFNSPEGDGVYYFLTVAVDQYGNVEDRDGDGRDDNSDQSALWDAYYSLDDPSVVQVDTEAPFTNLSLGEFGDDLWGKNRFAFNEQMINGNFEDDSDPGRGWVLEGDGDHSIVSNGDLAGLADTKGENSALIGWLDSLPENEQVDYIYQVVPVPDDGATFSFWYQIVSDDIVDYDWFEARIIDSSNESNFETILKTGSYFGGHYDPDWQEITYSLNNWFNQTVKVWFGVFNHDPEDSDPEPTFALIDDVRITKGENYLTPDKEIGVKTDDLGTGIDTTYYRINEGEWQELEDDSLVLSDEEVDDGEEVLVEYYSVDLAGNQEATRSLRLKADQEKDYFALVLNQISPRPSGSDAGNSGRPLDGEWVELWNNSDQAIDVAGWVLREGSGGYLVISSANSDNDNDLDDEGETIVPAHGWLRVYRNGDDDFTLNDNGDTVELWTDYPGSGGDLVDSFSYQAVAEDDKTWRRIPNGTGTWADPADSEEPILELKNLGGGKVLLVVKNLPENYDPETLWHYEIIYPTFEGVEQGEWGEILPEAIKERQLRKEVYLGICSRSDCVNRWDGKGKIKVRLYQGETILIQEQEFTI